MNPKILITSLLAIFFLNAQAQIDWTIQTSAADNSWQSVTYGNGLFVAVSISGSGNRVMTSPDGSSWTIRTSAADNVWNSVTFGNGLFVAVAESGSGDRVTFRFEGDGTASSDSPTAQAPNCSALVCVDPWRGVPLASAAILPGRR